MREPQRSKLGQAAARQQAPEPSKFMKAAAGARVLEPFTIPGLNLPAVMTLVPHHRELAIEADVIEELERKLKIPLGTSTESDYEAERAARTLTEAVLDPDAVARGDYLPIGELSDWRDLPRDWIGECWRLYLGVKAAYDPVSLPLSKEEIDAIDEVIKKKAEDPVRSRQLLHLFGVTRLSSYLLTMDEPRSASPTPTSTDSPSSVDG